MRHLSYTTLRDRPVMILAPRRSASVPVRAAALAWAAAGFASTTVAQEQAVPQLDPVVVTATRSAERAFDLPLAIDTVDRERIQNGQLQVNLSESLAGIPGLSIQNRWNYAQDLQLSIRGFGARANFGVRGIRLYQDYIPATMPDGQGQTGSFSLVSAQRIEVLRGPFSSLYGNASGGVISVFTEDGPPVPIAGAQLIGGSYATWNAIAKAAGQSGAVNYVLAGNYFTIDGYRDHSQASRELGNARLKITASPDTSIIVIANALYQPEAQDPLGLTRAQWEANPRQADPAATLFDTRKTVNQKQAGATVEQRLSTDADMRVTAYGGTRTVRQFLALSGVGPTSSGGVTDLDGTFGGVDARLIERFNLGGRPGSITLGANYESQRQQRRGYVNNNGDLGDLRRDETDNVSNTDGYLQFEYAFADPFSLLAGWRYSDVRFKSDDHYITSSNPDDSGTRAYSHGMPVAGLMWHVTDRVNVYANYGQGFETPTFIELAYRNVGSGLNFALQPAVSNSGEIGLKALIGRDQRVNVAAFDIRTSDEIVIDTAVGGRTTYKNAAKTERKGVEAAWQGNLGGGFAGVRVVYVPVGQVHRRRHHRRAAADRACGRAAAGRAGNERVRRAVVVLPAGSAGSTPRWRSSTPARSTSTTATPMRRRHGRSRACASASSRRQVRGCSANSRASTTSRTSTTSAPSSSAIRTAATSSRRRRAIS